MGAKIRITSYKYNTILLIRKLHIYLILVDSRNTFWRIALFLKRFVKKLLHLRTDSGTYITIKIKILFFLFEKHLKSWIPRFVKDFTMRLIYFLIYKILVPKLQMPWIIYQRLVFKQIFENSVYLEMFRNIRKIRKF